MTLTECCTFEALALGNTNNINHFILSKYGRDWNWLLKVLTGPVHLLGNCTTIELNLHDVCLFLALSKELHLEPITLMSVQFKSEEENNT